MAISANKAAAIAFVASVALWSIIFALMGVGTEIHRLRLAGSYTLIFAVFCAAYVRDLYQKTS